MREVQQSETAQSKREARGPTLLVAENQEMSFITFRIPGHSFLGFNLAEAEAAAVPPFIAGFPFPALSSLVTHH